MISDSSEATHVPALDGVRGLAIVLVLVLHFRVPALLGSPLGKIYDRLALAGWVGVDLFFVLSGFLITGILLDTKNDPHYLSNFFARRFLRIFPVYYGFLFFLYVLLAHLHPFRSAGYTNAVAHQAWFWLYGTNILIALHGTWSVAPGTAHFWSLAVEEQFYILWPAVIWCTPGRRVKRLCIALILGAPLLRLFLWSRGANPIANYVLMPTRVDALAIGALIAASLRDPTSRESLVRWARPLAIATAVAWIALFVARGEWSESDSVVQVVGYSIQDIFFAAVLVVTLGVNGRSTLGRLFETRLLRKLGHYSYAMYVLHPFVAGLVVPRLLRRRPAMLSDFGQQVAVLLIAIAVTTAVAALSWHVYEHPFLRLKRYFKYQNQRQIVTDHSTLGLLTPAGST